MEYLASKPPALKCWCGWDDYGKCYNCSRDPLLQYLTCADKLKHQCPECKSTPSLPNQEVYHYMRCSRIHRAAQGERKAT